MKYLKFALALVILVIIALLLRPSQISSPLTTQPAAIAACPIFPADNVWNTPINNLPLDPKSQVYVNSIGANTSVHPDFGSGLYEGAPIGIPYVVVAAGQARLPISFEYADESDPGPYPIPLNAPIEGGPNGTGDRHILAVEPAECKLYELYAAYPQTNNSWQTGSGAVFDLRSNALRPAGWTSADAAGLPLLAGLARYDEVAAGIIKHALRFTAQNTRDAYIWPARHKASDDSNPNLPPMGQRFRLKANFDISSYSRDTKVILTALKTYGMILADNGSNWYISGAPDAGWNNDELVGELRQIKGTSFEAVDESSLQVNPDSGQVAPRLTGLIPWAGTPQGTTINNGFARPLQARLTDQFNRPVAGVNVTFRSTNGPTAGATFAGGLTTYTTQSDSSGLANATLLTANNLTGNHDVTAQAEGLTFGVNFHLTNLTACPASPFVVVSTTDDGTGLNCGTLSRALLQATSNTTISFALPTDNLVDVTGELPTLATGLTIEGGTCATPVTLNGTGAAKITFERNIKLKNLIVRGFPFDVGAGNISQLNCVIITKQ